MILEDMEIGTARLQVMCMSETITIHLEKTNY